MRTNSQLTDVQDWYLFWHKNVCQLPYVSSKSRLCTFLQWNMHFHVFRRGRDRNIKMSGNFWFSLWHTVDTIRNESNQSRFLVTWVCSVAPAPGLAFHTKITEVYQIESVKLIAIIKVFFNTFTLKLTLYVLRFHIPAHIFNKQADNQRDSIITF